MSEAKTINALSVATGHDRRTLAKALRHVRPDGQVRGSPAWTMATATTAINQHFGRPRATLDRDGFAGVIEDRLEGWREIHSRPEHLVDIAETARMLKTTPDAILRRLRAGGPYRTAGSWKTGEGFQLSMIHLLEWSELVRAHLLRVREYGLLAELGMEA